MLGKKTRQASHRAGGPATKNNGVHIAVHLLPDFRAGALLVRIGVIGIAKLIDEIRTRGFIGDAFGHVLVILRMAFGNIGASEDDVGTHRTQIENFLAAHFIWHHEHELVTFLLGHQRQTDTGITGGTFDQGVAGFYFSGFLGGINHFQTDAVFNRPPRVHAFEFEINFAQAGIEMLGFDDGSITDQFKNALMHRHKNIWVGVTGYCTRGWRTWPSTAAWEEVAGGAPNEDGRATTRVNQLALRSNSRVNLSLA